MTQQSRARPYEDRNAVNVVPVIAAVNLVEPESSDELSSTEGVLVIDITQGEHSHHSNSDSDTEIGRAHV